ncbi:Serine/threonine protein kinase [hydrothermal vent metagenome]|uniref:Serine/threonine protein kinase n=1 Tax=hydrothermal vent metagenome TaxID=652676 RepID=A0A3B0ZP74_9ZZZZ
MTRSDDPGNKDGEKTQIKSGLPKAGEQGQVDDPATILDKTRISSHQGSSAKSGTADVAAPEGVVEDHGDNDVTRFKAPSQDHENGDVTRFKPPAQNKQHHESPKTRIKQSAVVSDKEPVIGEPEDKQKKVLKGRFLLEKVLGVGGMGIVYKAKDYLKVEAQDRDPYVAIKVLSEEFRTHPEAFIALQRESRKAQRIAHPNTVKVYDFDRDGDVVFMTMEYMEGKPLDQLIKQYQATGLPRDDVWHILSGMCSALAHAHSENIVHSDFKPGNVFVTTNGMAKIFDFGIARAVANIDRHTGKEQDQTVFDAGGLGALTPAYASLEMLQGETPDIRDDVYALGCVAYELFSGEHPFNRLPADEAYNKKLKPKRISDISKRQWRAIEAALSFKRENRTESVDAFYTQLTVKKKSKLLLITFLLFSTAGAAYYTSVQTDNVVPPVPQISESEIRNELEFNIRYNLYKENIEKLAAKPSFTAEWEENIWSEMQGVLGMLSGQPNEWYLSLREGIYQIYLTKIKALVTKSSYPQATILIENAYRYTEDDTLLNNQKTVLAETIRKKELQDKKRAERNRRLARERERERERADKKENKIVEETKNTALFDVALANVNKQLKCSSKLNMRDFNIAITKLRSLDIKRYGSIENRLSTELAQCITSIGKHYPDHARDAKRYALHIFKDNPALMAIVIKEKDACNLSIAGLGARGERAVCRDKLKGGGIGPVLVVIPADSGIEAFAIGKYETSIAELNEFCKTSSECNLQADKFADFPVTNVDISTISAYLKWLSNKTKKNYRLPTKKEWIYASKSKPYTLDPNRNCQLSVRGIEKGGSFVKAATGRQNGWGVVNYAGNAQELASETSRRLVALGGSHKSSMDDCTALTVSTHSGGADKYTGFRVARDIGEDR